MLSWRGRYDRLKLNTGRPFSHLPNRPYPKGTPMFPHRDDVIAHLERHAHEDGIELRLGTEVHRIDRRARGWRLETSTGEIDARQVVIANGNEHTPRIPEWPGTDEFTAEMLHSSAYRNPGPYPGKQSSGGRLRLVGNGDRTRPRDGRSGQGAGWRSGRRRTSCCARFPAACRVI